MPHDTAWLASLQVGEKVIIHRNGYGQEDVVRIVRRLTAKQIHVGLSLTLGSDVARFWRASGRSLEERSTYGARDTLLPWSREAEMRLAIRPLCETVSRALQQVSKRDCQALTLAQATAVVEALRHLGATIQGIDLDAKKEETSP